MDYTGPEAVEQAFYDAFMRQDLDAMMGVWAEGRSVICIHPGGVMLSERDHIEISWQQIFMAQVPFRFDLMYHSREQFGDTFALHHLNESLYLKDRMVGIVQVTNGYCVTEQGWRMVLHHASPPPEPDGEPEDAEPDPIIH